MLSKVKSPTWSLAIIWTSVLVTIGLLVSILIFYFRFTSEDTFVFLGPMDRFVSLSETNKQLWLQFFDEQINTISLGGGQGYSVGNDIAATPLTLQDASSLMFNKGMFIIFSGSDDCDICKVLLAKLPIWANTYAAHAIYSPFAESFNNTELTMPILASTRSVARVDQIGYSIPALTVVIDGTVVFKSLDKNIMRDLPYVEQLLRIYSSSSTQPIPLSQPVPSIEYLEPGTAPKSSLVFNKPDGSLLRLPEDLGDGPNLIYIHDPQCETSQVMIRPLFEVLQKLIGKKLPSLNIIILLQKDLEGSWKRDLATFQADFPELTFAFLTTEMSEHPLAQWGRILRPDILIFSGTTYRTSIPPLTINWSSQADEPDYSITIEATLQTIATLGPNSKLASSNH